jgi:hypothetical protein
MKAAQQSTVKAQLEKIKNKVGAGLNKTGGEESK